MNNYSNNTRSMNGLNNINANGGTFDDVTTNTLTVNSSSNVPTRPNLDSTSNIANTQFVTNAVNNAGSNYVDLTSTQTITGDKTFTGQADFLSLSTSYISNTSSIDTPSITSGLGTDNLNVAQNQTSGILFLGCRTNRTGAINIGTLATGNAPINIGSTSSTTQTSTHNAITTFNKIPLCSGVPATGNHLTNKTYVDTAISTVGAGFVDTTTNQTIAGIKTFSSIPQCATNSIGDNNDLINYGTLNQRFLDERPYFNPTGTIITFAGSSAPTGYLLCDGTLYSQFTYPTLFSVIFNTYGGSFPNFRVPNTQGLFISSAGSQTLNSITYTRTLATRQNDVIEDHKHTYSDMMWWDTDTGGGLGQTIFVAGADFQTPGGDTVGSNGDGNFSNRLTKATWPSTAVNPGTPAQQYNAPTNVSAITGTETHPANIAFNHYIKF